VSLPNHVRVYVLEKKSTPPPPPQGRISVDGILEGNRKNVKREKEKEERGK
jgi:hypothetical protein